MSVCHTDGAHEERKVSGQRPMDGDTDRTDEIAADHADRGNQVSRREALIRAGWSAPLVLAAASRAHAVNTPHSDGHYDREGHQNHCDNHNDAKNYRHGDSGIACFCDNYHIDTANTPNSHSDCHYNHTDGSSVCDRHGDTTVQHLDGPGHGDCHSNSPGRTHVDYPHVDG